MTGNKGPWLTPNQQMRVLEQWYAMQERGGTAVLVCIDCHTKVEQYFGNLYYMEDGQIAPHFTQRGWTIKPTRCPKCAEAATKGGA